MKTRTKSAVKIGALGWTVSAIMMAATAWYVIKALNMVLPHLNHVSH